jgi:hypothetical protein
MVILRWFIQQWLYCNGYTAMVYTAMVIYKKGYTAMVIYKKGYTAMFIYKKGYTAMFIYKKGYTARFIYKKGYTSMVILKGLYALDVQGLGILTFKAFAILLQCSALYTQPPFSISLTIFASILHF